MLEGLPLEDDTVQCTHRSRWVWFSCTTAFSLVWYSGTIVKYVYSQIITPINTIGQEDLGRPLIDQLWTNSMRLWLLKAGETVKVNYFDLPAMLSLSIVKYM